jgi:hypothetical protein
VQRVFLDDLRGCQWEETIGRGRTTWGGRIVSCALACTRVHSCMTWTDDCTVSSFVVAPVLREDVVVGVRQQATWRDRQYGGIASKLKLRNGEEHSGQGCGGAFAMRAETTHLVVPEPDLVVQDREQQDVVDERLESA